MILREQTRIREILFANEKDSFLQPHNLTDNAFRYRSPHISCGMWSIGISSYEMSSNALRKLFVTWRDYWAEVDLRATCWAAFLPLGTAKRGELRGKSMLCANRRMYRLSLLAVSAMADPARNATTSSDVSTIPLDMLPLTIFIVLSFFPALQHETVSNLLLLAAGDHQSTPTTSSSLLPMTR